MRDEEVIRAMNLVAGITLDLQQRHPDWQIETSLNQYFSAVSWHFGVNGLRYKYTLDLEAILKHNTEDMAWFIGQVVNEALKRGKNAV